MSRHRRTAATNPLKEHAPFVPTRSGAEFSGVASAGKLFIGRAKASVPNGTQQSTERPLSFAIDLLVVAA